MLFPLLNLSQKTGFGFLRANILGNDSNISADLRLKAVEFLLILVCREGEIEISDLHSSEYLPSSNGRFH